MLEKLEQNSDHDKLMQESYELGIDLKHIWNKVKNFFSEDKLALNNNVQTTDIRQNSDDKQKSSQDEFNIDFDFSKVKLFFKNLFSSDQAKTNNDEFDIKYVIDFMKKYPSLCILLLLMILQFMPNAGFLPWGGIWMRSLSQDLPLFDNLAKQNIENNLKNQVQLQIEKQYPNLPDDQKKKILSEQFDNVYSQQKQQILAAEKDLSRQLKDQYHYDVNNVAYTYMPDIDPYTFLRRARNYLEHGFPGDVKKDGKDWDNHMLAPLGVQVESTFHHYTLAYIHKVFSIFNPKIPLMQSAAYFPLIFSLLSMIPAFFITRKLAGDIGGVLAASFLILHAAFLNRTLWGHADTDAYNIFFPLYIFWFFFLMIESVDLKKKALFAVLSGFLIGLYSYVWSWWYIFDFILAAFALHFVGLFVFKNSDENPKEHINKLLINAGLIILTTGIFVSIFAGFNAFIRGPIEPLGFTIIKNAAHENLWPNVYTTVAELNALDIRGVFEKFGADILLICLSGAVFLLLKSVKKKEHMIYSLFLVVWFLATAYATTKGIRFLMLVVPPLAILFGSAFGIVFNFCNIYLKKEFKAPLWVSFVGVMIVGLFFLSLLVRSSFAASQSDLPIMNDAWWNILITIKEQSKQDAIITSWWDFGHQFKFVADRAVTFDGASQNTPIAHWIGRVLVTDDEKEAVGILRMLACGSNTAFEELNKKINNTPKTIDILYSILKLKKEDANQVLSKQIDNPDEILQYTHCGPAENFFITSDDMIGKAPVWAHFGLWDFKRAAAWIEAKKLKRDDAIKWAEEQGYSEEEADKLYRDLQSITSEDSANEWISPWPAYDTGSFVNCEIKSDGTYCSNGLRVKSNETFIEFNGAHVVPYSLIYFNNEKNITTKRFINSNIAFSAVLIPTREGYASFYTWPQLANSMFTKLYFMEGHGLKYFKKVVSIKQPIGGEIYLWKVDWDGGDPNVLSALKEKNNIEPDSIIKINYVSWLDNGTIIASTIKEWQSMNISKDISFENIETSPEQITLGSAGALNMVANQLMGMKKNDEKIISITPETLASMNAPPVFGNNTLFFRIKIENIL